MANPKGYNRGHSFAGDEAAKPGTPLPGSSLDVELDNIEAALDETQAALADVRRSDGALRNKVVTVDALAPDVLALMGTGAGSGSGGVVSPPLIYSGHAFSLEYFGAAGDYVPGATGHTDNRPAIEAALAEVSNNGGSVYVPAGLYYSTPVNVLLGDAPGYSLHGDGTSSSRFVCDEAAERLDFFHITRTKTGQKADWSGLSFSNACQDNTRYAGRALFYDSVFQTPDDGSRIAGVYGLGQSFVANQIAVQELDDDHKSNPFSGGIHLYNHRWPELSGVWVATSHPFGPDLADTAWSYYPHAGLAFEDCYYAKVWRYRMSHHGERGIYYRGIQNVAATPGVPHHRDFEGGVLGHGGIIVGHPRIGIELLHKHDFSDASQKEPGFTVMADHIHATQSAVRVSQHAYVSIDVANISMGTNQRKIAGLNSQQKAIDLDRCHDVLIRGLSFQDGGYFRSMDDCLIQVNVGQKCNNIMVDGLALSTQGIAVQFEDTPQQFTIGAARLTGRAPAGGPNVTLLDRPTVDFRFLKAPSGIFGGDTEEVEDHRRVDTLVSRSKFERGPGWWRDSNTVDGEPTWGMNLPPGAPARYVAGIEMQGDTIFDGSYVKDAYYAPRRIKYKVSAWMPNNTDTLSVQIKQRDAAGNFDIYRREVFGASDVGWLYGEVIVEIRQDKADLVSGGWRAEIFRSNGVPSEKPWICEVKGEFVDPATPDGVVAGSVKAIDEAWFVGNINVTGTPIVGSPLTVSLPAVYGASSAPTVLVKFNAGTVTTSGGVWTQSGGVWTATDMLVTTSGTVQDTLRVKVYAHGASGFTRRLLKRVGVFVSGSGAPLFTAAPVFSALADLSVPITTLPIGVYAYMNAGTVTAGSAYDLTTSLSYVDGNTVVDITPDVEVYAPGVWRVFLASEYDGKSLLWRVSAQSTNPALAGVPAAEATTQLYAGAAVAAPVVAASISNTSPNDGQAVTLSYTVSGAYDSTAPAVTYDGTTVAGLVWSQSGNTFTATYAPGGNFAAATKSLVLSVTATGAGGTSPVSTATATVHAVLPTLSYAAISAPEGTIVDAAPIVTGSQPLGYLRVSGPGWDGVSATTGHITGTATAGSGSIVVEVSNAAGSVQATVPATISAATAYAATISALPRDYIILDTGAAHRGYGLGGRPRMGRRPTTAPLDPVVDAASLPAGVTVSGNTITVGPSFSAATPITNFGMRGYKIEVSGPDFAAVDCEFGEMEWDGVSAHTFATGLTNSSAASSSVDAIGFTGTLSNFDVQHCDFFGAQDVRGFRGACYPAYASVQTLTFACNFVTGFPFDALKTFGAALTPATVRDNDFYYTGAAHDSVTTWDSGTTYAAGDQAYDAAGKLCISKVAGNVGNTPPTGAATSDAFWFKPDPHCDLYNAKASFGAGTNIFRNKFVDACANGNSLIASGLWVIPDAGQSVVWNSVRIESNYIDAGRPLTALFTGASATDGVLEITGNAVWGGGPGLNYGSGVQSDASNFKWADNFNYRSNVMALWHIGGEVRIGGPAPSITDRAVLPLSGTTDAPDGAVIEARAVSVDDGGATTTNWQVAGTASGGAWAGDAVMPRSSSWYRPEARVYGSAAPAGTIAQRVGAGITLLKEGASNTDRGTGAAADPLGAPVETIGVNAAGSQFFMVTDRTDGYDHQFVNDTDGWSSNIPAFRAMAASVHALTPGLKVHVIYDSNSGANEYTALNDGDDATKRTWAGHVAFLNAVTTAGGSEVIAPIGMWLLDGTSYKTGPGMTLPASYAEMVTRIWFGKDATGADVAALQPDADDTVTLSGQSAGGYTINHIFPHSCPTLRTGRTVLLLGNASAYSTNASLTFDPFADGVVNNETVRAAAYPAIVAAAPGSTLRLPDYDLVKRGMTDAVGTIIDNLHIENGKEGFSRKFKGQITAILQATGIVPFAVPVFDDIEWTANWLRLGSSAGPVTTEWLKANGAGTTFRNGTSMALGFLDGALAAPTTVQIRAKNPDGSPGALAAAGSVYIYPESGQTFDGNSQMYWRLGSHFRGAVDADWGYDDGTGGGYKHVPIVDVGLSNMAGWMVDPKFGDVDFINNANALVGIETFAVAANSPYFRASTSIGTGTPGVTVRALVSRTSGASMRLLGDSGSASNHKVGIATDGSLQIAFASSVSGQFVNVTVSNASTAGVLQDWHILIDPATNSCRVWRDGVELTGTGLGTGLSWTNDTFKFATNIYALYKTPTADTAGDVSYLEIYPEAFVYGASPAGTPILDVSASAGAPVVTVGTQL